MRQSPDVPPAALSVVDSLAVAQWGVPWAAAGEATLDLRYAPDEDILLDPTPRSIWAKLLGASADAGAELASHYAVTDPYGAGRGAPVVSAFFGVRVHPEQLTFGAGVTSLLHDLSHLASAGAIAAPALVHSDLEVWAASHGNSIRLFADPLSWEHIASEVRQTRPALLHLDRPTFTGHLMPLSELQRLVTIAASTGAIVLVDESPATYLGCDVSAVRLVPNVENLVVLRGFTKAYSMGGLRAGFAVASNNIASQVRELVTPLQVSEIAFAAALKMLEAGEVFPRLLARIHELKPQVLALLQSAGLSVIDGHPDLPWIAIRDDDGAGVRWLEQRGIRPLLPTTALVFPTAFRTKGGGVFRLTIPLSDERLSSMRGLLELCCIRADAC